MIYDLSLGMSWLPRDVRELTTADLDGLARAARRRDARSKRKR
jgi:hypothetical protein